MANGVPPTGVKELMGRALLELRDAKARARRLEERAFGPVAVIGMSCRFPGGADSADAFRDLLWSGTDAIVRVPGDRWDADAHLDANPDAEGAIVTPFGGFIGDAARFDAAFFGISPREAESIDPQHRLLLETAWHALEHAGLPPGELRGTETGVFIGICTYDYAIRHLTGGERGSAYFGIGNALSAAAGRVSYQLGFTGPSLSVDTACSSSLVAVHLACQALRNGECTTSLAGGVNLMLAPQTSVSFSRAHMLAPDGRCKPFDAAANGYVRGEGCGVVVLKLLADAERDGDPILAVIRGSAVNQDGASSGLTVPSGPAQQAVMRKALANARRSPEEVSYVEAHGTGTALGDPIEARSLHAVYGADRPASAPLWVGSVKSNIGHLEGAAGVASLIKTVLALQHGVLPPSLHFSRLNDNIDWPDEQLRVVTERRTWTGETRVAAVSSFGFTGTNAHVVVEAAPARAAGAAASRVPLAPHPFRAERHWLPERTPEPSRATRTFRHLLSPASPAYFADHVVGGRVVVPAAALVELIASGARSALGAGPIAVADFRIHRPVVLSAAAPRTVEVRLDAHGDALRATLHLHIPEQSGSALRELIAEAVVERASENPPPAAAPVAPDAGDVSVAAVYAACRERGLDYGPAFQTLIAVAHDGGTAQAEIRLTPDAGAAGGRVLHPALLDGCLQGAAVLYPAPGDGALYVPVGLRRLTVFTDGADAVRCTATLTSSAPERLVVDLQLCAPDGSVVATATGVTLARVDARSLGAGTDAPARQPEAAGDDVRAAVAAVLRLAPEKVDPELPLTALGLDSLMALELRNRLGDAFGVDVPAVDLLRDLTVRAIEARVAAPAPAETATVQPAAEPDALALSHGQRALWYLHQLAPESPAYHIAFAVRVRSAVDPTAFAAAVAALGERHPQLRSTYHETPSGPVQRTDRAAGPVFVPYAADGLDDDELHRRVVAAYRAPFDLAHGPIARIVLFTRAPHDHVLLIAIHHIAADAWSLWRIMEELREFYAAACAGRIPALPLPSYRYADNVADEAAFVDGPGAAAAWAFWAGELAGDLPLLALPTDRPRPPVQTFRGASLPFHLGADESTRLQAFARAEGTTVYTVLLAAYQTLLHRYSGQDDILVGCPAAGRDRAAAAETVGYFVNPVVVRARFAPAASFRTVLAAARSRLLGALQHQALPFPLVAERFGGPRNAGHAPVFQAAFVMQQLQDATAFASLMAPSDPVRTVEWGGLRLEHYFLPQQEGQFDLTLEMVQADGACHGLLKYNADLWDATTISRMATHLRTLLAAALDRPDAPADALPLLDADERSAVLALAAGPARSYDVERPLHRAIEEQAARTPDAAALEADGDTLSYAELNGLANRVARELRAGGTGAGDRVGVCAERGLGLVVGLLAVLKTGAAYVPLDPAWPPERLRFMVADVAPTALLTSRATRSLAAAIAPETARFDLDDALAGPREIAANLPDAPHASAPAYAIYTSGSTGAPKAALNAHRAIANRLDWMQEAFALGPDDRVLQKTPYSFDVSVWELFWPLRTGARLVLAKPEGHRDNAYLVDLIRASGITTLHFVPPMLQAFLDEAGAAECRSLRRVICSGQELTDAVRRRFFAVLPHAELHNLYGPTEAAVDVTWHRCAVGDPRPFVPIGRPIANTGMYVLDARRAPQPVGVPGELFIGGVQVGLGYLGRPALTAERFGPDPFGPPGSRLYRTGDVARFRTDGEIEFLGRTDFQVKIRGLRVELGEIEHALATQPGVREALVLLREERPGVTRLTAYVAGAAVPPEPALRAALATRLPAYMLPDAFVRLDALPLTANGKVDRRALPAPAAAVARPQRPRCAPEERLAEVWRSVLNLPDVGVDDNFFALGGDSIRSTQLVALARRAGFTLTVRDVLAHPTIAELAQIVAGASAVPPLDAADGGAAGLLPLTPMQHRFFADASASAARFDQAVVLRSSIPLRADALQAALSDVTARHAALRLRFPALPDGTRAAVVAPDGGVALVRWNADDDRSLDAAIEAARAFDLASGPLAAALLIDDPADPRLFLIAHHLIVDGVSWRILTAELETAYRERCAERPPAFRAPAAPYAAWARAAAAFASGSAAASEVLFWLAEDWSRTLPVLPAHDHDAATGADELTFELPCALLGAGADAAPGQRIEATLLAGLAAAFGTATLRVDLEGHGREAFDGAPDGFGVVGWCTALYPVLVSIPDGSGAERSAAVAAALADVPAGGRAFGLCRTFSRSPKLRAALDRIPPAEILFNYLGRLDGAPAPGALFALEPAEGTLLRDPDAAPPYPLEINALQRGDRLRLALRFDRRRLDAAAVRALAERWRSELVAAADAAPPAVPLTPMQQGMLFHALLHPESGLYVQQLVVELDAAADPAVLAEAWDAVLSRHAALRTAFRWSGLDAPIQQAAAAAAMPWSVEDRRGEDDGAVAAAVAAYLDADRRSGFDLGVAPLHRVRLFRHAGGSTMVWTHHHLLLDGESLFLVLHEVLEICRALAERRPFALPAAGSFFAFAARPQAADPRAALDYWRRELAGVTAPPAIPFLARAADGVPGEAAAADGALSPEETTSLVALARAAGVTLNLLTQSVLALVLGRLSGNDRVLFGATVSAEHDPTAPGLYINTVPIRIDLPPDGEFGPWLTERRQAQADRSAFEATPLVEIQRCSGIPAGEPPFELLVLFENYTVEDALRRNDGPYAVRALRVTERTNYPLALSLLPGTTLGIRLVYDTARYPADAAAHFVEAYLAALRRAAQLGLDAPLRALTAPDPATFGRLVGTPQPVRSVVERFQKQVARHPDAVAIVCGADRRTYRELAGRARAIAADLRALGIGRGSVVGLCAGRDPDLIAALLGILGSGAAYLPLDPALPAERLAYMLSASSAVLTLASGSVDAALLDRLVTVAPLRLLDAIGPAPTGAAGWVTPGPDDLMYVLYTSGSTGRPKGVMVPHRAAANLLDAIVRDPGLGPDDAVLGLTTLAFDISVVEVFGTLIAGGRIVLAPRADDPRALLRLIDEEAVTVVQATPTTFRLLVAAGWSGRPGVRAFCGGEALTRDLSRAILARCDRLWNLYGPTETTVYSVGGEVPREVGPTDVGEPIGRPLPNVAAYVLDEGLAPMPTGAPGELWIGGAGVARGYDGQPGLTADRFRPDPFAARSGVRMYRTGDRARVRPDGAIDYLGRLDDQVKLRGQRIELGEIEAVLGAHPAVSVCAGALHAEPGDEPRLVAYVIPRAGAALDETVLRDHLRTQLSEAMIPARFVVLASMPVLPSGKVDRRALPAPAPLAHPAGTEPPATPLEREIAAVWSGVLGLPEPPADQSFFHLGGNSLDLIRVQTRLADRAGVAVDVVDLFRHPTIRQLAGLLARRAEGAAMPEPGERPEVRAATGDAQLHQRAARRAARARLQGEVPS